LHLKDSGSYETDKCFI